MDDHDLDALMREAAPPVRDDAFILAVIERAETARQRRNWARGLVQPIAIAGGAVGAWLLLQLMVFQGALTPSIDLGGPVLLLGTVTLSLLVARQMFGAFGR